jgi:hypothetical protein
MPTEANDLVTIMIRMRPEVAPKVSGGLVAIEEDIREHEPRLAVTAVTSDVVPIDGWPITCNIHSKWYVGGKLVGEVHGEIAEQRVDCIVTIGDKRLLAGTVDDWWTMLFSYLALPAF